MLSFSVFLDSSLLSYAINYEIQAPLFKWLDENTEKTKWVRFPATCAFVASSLISTITRIMGVAESFFYGFAIFLTSPLSENKIENATLGLHEMFISTSKNILRVTFVVLEILVDGIGGALACPKFYIINMSESMKVNLDHARNGTIGSDQYKKDSSKASGIAKGRLLAYQKATS